MCTDFNLTAVSCGACHVRFSIPIGLETKARADSAVSFWCPNGHKVHYSESELDLERRARQLAEQRIARMQDEKIAAINAQHKAERALKRHQKRAAAGVCPCCTRTFTNMARHMKTKHPDFSGGVTPLVARAA
jgi:hypothetical protein